MLVDDSNLAVFISKIVNKILVDQLQAFGRISIVQTMLVSNIATVDDDGATSLWQK